MFSSRSTRFQSLVSIQGPEGYGPSTLPLRHSESMCTLSPINNLKCNFEFASQFSTCKATFDPLFEETKSRQTLASACYCRLLDLSRFMQLEIIYIIHCTQKAGNIVNLPMATAVPSISWSLMYTWTAERRSSRMIVSPQHQHSFNKATLGIVTYLTPCTSSWQAASLMIAHVFSGGISRIVVWLNFTILI